MGKGKGKKKAKEKGSSSAAIGPEESMLFVFRNSKDQLEVHRKALQMLNSINGPIIVVSVCGSAKQGKSYLLNKLFQGHAEFLVKYPCKNGLRLSKPIQKTTSNGTKYNILVIDTEAIDQIGTYNTEIFSLAILLSNLIIYNQMGGINEAALDRLAFVIQMTEHIKNKAEKAKDIDRKLGSQHFVWLLRIALLTSKVFRQTKQDFYLKSERYMEFALANVKGDGNDVSTKNEIRNSICAYFPKRYCFTLAPPWIEKKDLQKEEPGPEFMKDIYLLETLCSNKSRIKFIVSRKQGVKKLMLKLLSFICLVLPPTLFLLFENAAKKIQESTPKFNNPTIQVTHVKHFQQFIERELQVVY
ncbi:guanylate-binding protein 2-like [Ipomoea triloba]|uniref:guanylate-binding protein 2-like n=1 Tax=Ipomoea triloba TaxID=35885 RepID=UPI00125DDE77|nr:guanylate-binding protein 2-like [Ipomoea triloba]